MPKLLDYSNDSNIESNITLSADPIDWGWNQSTLYPVKTINGYVIVGDFNDPAHIQYGIFNKNMNIDSVVCGMSVDVVAGKEFNLPVKEAAVIENVATKTSERGKGFAKILYEYILDKYNVIFSDIKLFADKIKNVGSINIWTNFLPKISSVFNYNIKTKTYSQFDTNLGNSEDVRYVAIKDKNIANTLTESFKDWLKKNALKTTATMALAGMNNVAYNDELEQTKDNAIIFSKPQISYYQTVEPKNTPPPSHIEQPKEKIEIPQNDDKLIDISIISKIESNNKSRAKSNKNARGLCQLKKEAWNEAQKDLYGKIKYTFEKYAYNPSINKKIADHYYNVILPKHLDSFGIPVTTETLLASYNYGSTNVKNIMKRYGNHWIKKLPLETKNYIESYKNIENL